MPETKTPGRLLPYERTNYTEKLTSFKRRLEEQVKVLKIGIKNGDVNDPKIAERFAYKTERFLATSFFTEKDYMSKRVQDLKRDLKKYVFVYKTISEIYAERIISKRSHKVLMAERYTFSDGKFGDFYYPYEYQKFYETDLEYLNSVKPKYDSQLVLVNRLKGILADRVFLKDILGCKNSWKVSTLKESLTEWVQDHSLEAEFELEEIFSLHFFNQKKFLSKDVSEFKEAVDIYAKSLETIIEWLSKRIAEDTSQIEYISKNDWKNCLLNIHDMFRIYDDFITTCSSEKKIIDDMYSLYRFGQGLIEADIFDSLYK